MNLIYKIDAVIFCLVGILLIIKVIRRRMGVKEKNKKVNKTSKIITQEELKQEVEKLRIALYEQGSDYKKRITELEQKNRREKKEKEKEYNEIRNKYDILCGDLEKSPESKQYKEAIKNQYAKEKESQKKEIYRLNEKVYALSNRVNQKSEEGKAFKKENEDKEERIAYLQRMLDENIVKTVRLKKTEKVIKIFSEKEKEILEEIDKLLRKKENMPYVIIALKEKVQEFEKRIRLQGENISKKRLIINMYDNQVRYLLEEISGIKNIGSEKDFILKSKGKPKQSGSTKTSFDLKEINKEMAEYKKLKSVDSV